MKNSWLNFWKSISINTQESKPYFNTIGWVLILSFSVYYIVNMNAVVINGYENLYLRLLIIFFGIMLTCHKYWPKFLIKITPFVFYCILFISFPFFFSFMLFKNITSDVWHVNGLVGFILLAFFVEWITFILLSLGGIVIAYIASGLPWNKEMFVYLLPIFSSYSGTIIYLVFFSMKKKVLKKDKDIWTERITQLNFDLEQKVLERTKDLKKALSVKTEFLNNISHEIRTPVHGFMGISEGLDLNWDQYSDKEKHKYTKEISKNAKRLNSLLGNLLDLSKFHEGKMLFDFTIFDINSVIAEIIDEANSLYIKDSGINIIFKKKEKIFINADRERISQLLRNLLVNAIKFSPKDGEIKINLIFKNEKIYCAISDQGTGIPENEIKDIFNPFTQSTRTKTKAGGTGLGLAICKEIIENHNGRIWAENNNNQGSTFNFVIPVLEEIKTLAINSHSDASATILVIDDESSCLSSMELLLSGTNYKLITASGGIEGLEILQSNKDKINLILLDLMMPDMYGINVLAEIKKDPALKHIPVILQTGTSDKSEIDKAIAMGADAYIKKPYLSTDIIDKIKSFL